MLRLVSVVRLTLFLTGLGLAASRLGLVLHELVGHGGVALALGGRVVEVSLFWFGGGWARTWQPDATVASALAVDLGGITVELVAGALLWGMGRRLAAAGTRAAGAISAAEGAGAPDASRRRLLLADCCRLVGALFVTHGLWYAATGTWHGFGDGARLHQLLGAARDPVAVALGGGVCAVAAVATRRLCHAFAPALAGSTPTRLRAVMAAAGLAAGLHAALTFGELAIRRDDTYRQTMRTAEQRETEARVAQWRAELARRGRVPADAEANSKARELAPPPPFPFARVLAATALLAVLAGAWSLRHARWELVSSRPALADGDVVIALAAAALAVAAMALLGGC
jgi:hypothetical protein